MVQKREVKLKNDEVNINIFKKIYYNLRAIRNSIKNSLNSVSIFRYNIGNLHYKCFGVKSNEKLLGGKQTLNIILEIKNYEKRKLTRKVKMDVVSFDEKYAAGELGCGFKEINDMGNLFVDWLNKHKDFYIKIYPYGDFPAKRMRIFDRVLRKAGYNILYIKKSHHKEINCCRKLYTPYTFFYSRNKDEWIDRKDYDNWMKETIKLEREMHEGRIQF